MKKTLIIAATAAIAMAMTSCSSKLGALSADNFKVTPNPMATVADQVPVTINGQFPEKYMNKKAVVTVTPELRFGSQAVRGQSATFQGEKVLGNDQTISYVMGGNYTMRSNWNYIDAMHKSDLYLTFDARIGNKKVEVPAVKVATGIVATSNLYHKALLSQAGSVAPDAFMHATEAKQEANVKFLIQQAELRKSELQNNSVQEFVSLLKRINADREKLVLTSVDVNAYASPDGGLDLNDKLATKRQKNSEAYVKQQLKQTGLNTYVDANYTAQDWDGFQQLVAASNIQDKEVILRVLSMYTDPQEREQQIKNISAAFRELADGILPELRRSRMTINYEIIGRTDSEIKEQYQADPAELSIEELLYAATLTKDVTEKESIYRQAAKIYPNEARALNNIGSMRFIQGDLEEANNYFMKAAAANPNCEEANANLGLIALINGDKARAEELLSKAPKAQNVKELLGDLYLAQGNIAQAETYFGSKPSNAAALAQLLNKNYTVAASTLKNVKNADALTYYLQAIVNARTQNYSAASDALRAAIEADPSYAQYAAQDLELVNVRR